MPGGGLLNVIHHDLTSLVRVVVVHDEHNALLEEGVRLLVALFLQGQQAVLTGHLGQLHQLVDNGQGIVALGVHNHLQVLGNVLQRTGGEGCDHDHDRTSDDDEDTGGVKEVLQLARGQQSLRAAEHHTDQHNHNCADNTDYIGNIHIFSHPF